MKFITASFLLVFALATALTTPALAGLSQHDVLLVVNDASPVSVAIGNYYQAARGIPDVNVCHLTTSIACPTTDEISPEVWYDKIRTPIWDHINTTYPWLKDQIKVILLTKGVPIRIWGDTCRHSSVDMPLSYLDNISGAGTEPLGSFIDGELMFYNPYFCQDESFDNFRTSAANASADRLSFPIITSVSEFDSGVIIAAGADGLLMRSTDRTSWSPISDRNRRFAGTPMSFVTGIAGRGWALQENGRMLRSTDNGASWDVVRWYSPDTLQCISFADANNGWAVGSQSGAAIVLKTTSGGSYGTWSSVGLSSLSLPSCILNGVSAAGTEGVVACGSGGVVVSRVFVEGEWTWVKATGIPNVYYNGVVLKPSDTTYVGWVVGDNGKILKTTDGGSTWTEQNSGQTLSLIRVHALDENHAWVTTNTSTLLRTTDGGATWQTLTLQLGQNIRSVYFTDTNSGFAANNTNSILSTNDGGTTWSPVFTGQKTTWHQKYLVCRLDGYQEPADANGLPLDIKRMIDNACNSDSSGRFIIDNRLAGGDGQQLGDASATLIAMKNNGSPGIEEVLFDESVLFLKNQQRVMGYASWGSNDWESAGQSQHAKPRNSWQKGSVSTTYVSSCGRSLNYPPDYANPVPKLSSSLAPAGLFQVSGCWQGWTGVLHNNDTGQEVTATSNSYGFLDFPLTEAITNGYLKLFNPDGLEITTARITAPASSLAPQNKYKLEYQSLVADLIREGCDASIGNVYEPKLPACGQPQYLLPRYASGYTWAESAYMSMKWAGWQEIAVGDPLMAAYATPPTVALTSPGTDGAVISGTAYSVTATATPVNASGINRVEFWLSNGQGIDALIGVDDSAPYSITFDTTALPAPYNSAIPDGRYIIEAIAYEDTNVRECGRFSRPVVINNGGSPTSVSITSPAVDGVTLSNMSTNTVSVTPYTSPATERAELWLQCPTRDKLIGTITSFSSSVANCFINTLEVPDGDYTLQTVVYSTTGQASASAVRQVTIDNSALVRNRTSYRRSTEVRQVHFNSIY